MLKFNSELNGAKILWSNPNPTSNFSNQDVTLSSDDYDELIFYFRSGTTNNTMFTATALKGYNAIVDNLININEGQSQNVGIRERVCTYVNDKLYSISKARIRNNINGTSAPTTDTQYLIPIYIVGYKKINITNTE